MMHLISSEAQKRAYESFVYESRRAACEIGYWMLDQRHAYWIMAEPGWEEVAEYVAQWLRGVLGRGATP
jgi:hypothetical protein